MRLRDTAASEAASQRSSRCPAAAPSAPNSTRSPFLTMAERLDGNLATLKAVVIVMGILIIVGFAVVAVEITRRVAGIGTASAPVGTRTINLPSGCAVAKIAGVGDRLVLRIEPAASCPDLIYLDASGQEVGRIDLAPAP